MKAILKINDKEIEVEVSDEQIKKLTKKKSPFERLSYRETFFCTGPDGTITGCLEYKEEYCDALYNSGNYCADEDLIQQQAWREVLNRLLWRWQYENDKPVVWNDHRVSKFNIHYDTINNEFITCWNDVCKGNTVYFSTEEKAYQAIEEVVKPFMQEHPDFVW